MRGPPVVVEDMYAEEEKLFSSYMYIVHNCLLVKTKDLKKQKYSQMYSSFEVKIPKQTTEFSLSQNIYPGNINNQIMVNSESQKKLKITLKPLNKFTDF